MAKTTLLVVLPVFLSLFICINTYKPIYGDMTPRSAPRTTPRTVTRTSISLPPYTHPPPPSSSLPPLSFPRNGDIYAILLIALTLSKYPLARYAFKNSNSPHPTLASLCRFVSGDCLGVSRGLISRRAGHIHPFSLTFVRSQAFRHLEGGFLNSWFYGRFPSVPSGTAQNLKSFDDLKPPQVSASQTRSKYERSTTEDRAQMAHQ